MTGLGLAAGGVAAWPTDADVFAAGRVAAALFVSMVAVASAAFFFVGIVAFRSVGATAFVADALVDLELSIAFGAGLGGVLSASVLLASVLAGAAVRALVGTGFIGTGLIDAGPAETALDTDAFGLVTFVRAALLVALRAEAFAAPALGATPSFASVRARAGVAAAFPRAAGVALARFTDAAGCAAVRAAALDVATRLAVPADKDFAAPADLAAAALGALDCAVVVRADLIETGLADLVAASFVAVDLAAVDLVDLTTDVRAAAFGLRSGATGLVLGDMSATPEIDGREEA